MEPVWAPGSGEDPGESGWRQRASEPMGELSGSVWSWTAYSERARCSYGREACLPSFCTESSAINRRNKEGFTIDGIYLLSLYLVRGPEIEANRNDQVFLGFGYLTFQELSSYRSQSQSQISAPWRSRGRLSKFLHTKDTTQQLLSSVLDTQVS